MDYYLYRIDQIEKITESELVYREDRGDLISIDLHKCRDRYLKYMNAHLDEYPERKSIPLEDTSDFICVGDHCFDGLGNPYFEFYDWPHARFEIKIRRTAFKKLLSWLGWDWQRKYSRKFHELQNQIQLAGWRTRDLS